MFKILRSLRSAKCLKTTVELTFTTQKVNACNPWTAYFVSTDRFRVNLVQKNQNCYFKRKFGTKTDLNMRKLMIMFTFTIFDWKYLLG